MKAFSFRRLRTRLAAAAIVLTALAFPVAALASQDIKLESSLGVANVTNGDTKYAQSVSAKYDDVVKLQVYYHNTELPDSGKIAKNLTVKINIPSGKGGTQNVTSTVSADNAKAVNSTASIKLANSDAYLQYIPGSAVWKHNTGTNDKVTYVESKISDDVVTSGAGLRLEDEKPCFNFSATVTVLARVMVPGVTVTKQVEKSTDTNKWATSNTANPGDTLKYLISYTNSGNAVEDQVILRDNLPAHETLVPGTTYLADASHPNGVKVEDLVNQGGINAGNFGAGANAFLTFEVKLDDASKFQCGTTTLTNVGVAHPKNMSEYYSMAKTTVTKTCESTPETPVYSCDLFHLTVNKEDRKVTVDKFDYTAKNGATFKNVVIDWGDQSEALTTDSPVGKTYQYAKDGSYTITATAHFTANDKDVTSTGSCTQTVEFTTPGTPTTPTTPPSELPNTGAGDVIGLVSAVTVAGAVAHRLFSRRFARQ